MEGEHDSSKLQVFMSLPTQPQQPSISTNLNPRYSVIQAWSPDQSDHSRDRDIIAPDPVPMSISEGDNHFQDSSAEEGKSLDLTSSHPDDCSSELQNVDQLRPIESQQSSTIHESWKNFIQSYLLKVEENFTYVKSEFTKFGQHPAATRPNSQEYRESAVRLIDMMLAQSQDSVRLYVELRGSFAQWDTSYPRDVFCSICNQEKPPSGLSCPRKDVLCLECAGKRYMNNELSCVCGVAWSRDQCQGLHDSLKVAQIYEVMPEKSLHPLDEVECLHCHRFVGEAALDPYICSKSHNICKKCAKDLGQTCPACEAEQVA